MALNVTSFGGGIAVDSSADTKRTDEVEVADNVDIGPRGALIVTTIPKDYLTLLDQPGNPWSKLWSLLEAGGFNFSKVFAVGEGDPGTGIISYIFSSFNRENEASPVAFVVGSVFPPALGAPAVLSNGIQVTGAEFAGVFWIRFGSPGGAVAGDPDAGRFYFVCLGAREGTAPTAAPGLFVVDSFAPAAALSADQIMRFDALGTGDSGSLGVPVAYKDGEGGANFGSLARQLFFRGVIAYNNHMFGWGYDSADDRRIQINGITNAGNGVVTTAAAHGFKTGNVVRITGVQGMTQVNGQSFTITVTGANTFQLNVNTAAYGVYVAGAGDWAATGAGDGPNRVMFSNLGRPLKWGNDQGSAGADRSFADSDAIVLGDAGEIVRGAIVWDGKLIFGTNKGLHYIAGYGRDSFLTDGANPIMRSFNIVGPKAMVEGPDKCLYGVGDQGLWCLPSLGEVPKPVFQSLRDFNQKSLGYWDLIWTDVTRGVAVPGTTNQDLVWTAVDWDKQQVVVGIPWCSIVNGYGYGTDTVVLKYDVRNGGFTRQQFPNQIINASGYFRSQAGQAAVKFLSVFNTADVMRYGYTGYSPFSPTRLPLPSSAKVRVGPYAPFAAAGRGTVRRMYLTLALEPVQTINQVQSIDAITNANPANVHTSVPHGLVTGDQVEIYSIRRNQTMKEIVGGPYTITVTGIQNFTLNGVDSTLFGVYVPGSPLRWNQPVAFQCHLRVDGNDVLTPDLDPQLAIFKLSVQCCYPASPMEGDLWADMSLDDPSIGNATAGVITPAQPGYLLWQRRDSLPVIITGATRANPCVVTAPAHGLTTGDRISIREVVGMVQLNNAVFPGPYTKDYTVVRIDADHFSLSGIDSSGFTAYSSGGRVFKAWWQIPGVLGGQGSQTNQADVPLPRMTIPLPVARKPGTRITFEVSCTVLARRWQLEGIGFNPGDGTLNT